MNYQIVNEKLNIAACSLADLAIEQVHQMLNQWEYGAKLKSLTMFYDRGEKILVLNKDNPNYKKYLDLAECYLALSDKKREDYSKVAPEEIGEEIRVMDDYINGKKVSKMMYMIDKNASVGKLDCILKSIYFSPDNNKFQLLFRAYCYGVICGKRAERAKRKMCNE